MQHMAVHQPAPLHPSEPRQPGWEPMHRTIVYEPVLNYLLNVNGYKMPYLAKCSFKMPKLLKLMDREVKKLNLALVKCVLI